MKKFVLYRKGEKRSSKTIRVAAFLGWGLEHVGYAVLDQLEVGETTIDDDGDTWERVE